MNPGTVQCWDQPLQIFPSHSATFPENLGVAPALPCPSPSPSPGLFKQINTQRLILSNPGGKPFRPPSVCDPQLHSSSHSCLPFLPFPPFPPFPPSLNPSPAPPPHSLKTQNSPSVSARAWGQKRKPSVGEISFASQPIRFVSQPRPVRNQRGAGLARRGWDALAEGESKERKSGDHRFVIFSLQVGGVGSGSVSCL